MMRKTARWLAGTVLVLDLVFVLLVLTGVWSQPLAQGAPSPAADDAVLGDNATNDEWTRSAVEELGRRLAERNAELDHRDQELRELMRGLEVLRQTGVLDDTAGVESAAGDAAAAVAAEPAVDSVAQEAFRRLQRAYENMEPTSAAMALERLAAKDRDAVVRLIAGWNPRVSGAILDELTQNNPELSADLAYEIWKRGAD